MCTRPPQSVLVGNLLPGQRQLDLDALAAFLEMGQRRPIYKFLLRTDAHGLARVGLDEQDEDQQSVAHDDSDEQAFGLAIFAEKEKAGEQDQEKAKPQPDHEREHHPRIILAIGPGLYANATPTSGVPSSNRHLKRNSGICVVLKGYGRDHDQHEHQRHRLPPRVLSQGANYENTDLLSSNHRDR